MRLNGEKKKEEKQQNKTTFSKFSIMPLVRFEK